MLCEIGEGWGVVLCERDEGGVCVVLCEKEQERGSEAATFWKMVYENFGRKPFSKILQCIFQSTEIVCN